MDERAEKRMAAREEILQVEREMEEKRREGQQEQEENADNIWKHFPANADNVWQCASGTTAVCHVAQHPFTQPSTSPQSLGSIPPTSQPPSPYNYLPQQPSLPPTVPTSIHITPALPSTVIPALSLPSM